MFGLTEGDRKTLALLALLLLCGLLLIWRQRQHAPWGITARPPDAPELARWDRRLDAARKVDVNTADVAELERLPGIGPALARRIVSYRDAHGAFSRVDALLEVEGIGPKTLEALEDYLRVGH